MKKNNIISAAGGNNTAIAIIETELTREKYEQIGSDLLKETERKGVEQAGFLIPSIKHFEMSGGEFCGNAARSAALLLSKILDEKEFNFTMSGFGGEVKAMVEFDKNDSSIANVSCYFNGLKARVEEKEVNSKKIHVVDLGGIVHCILHEDFPKDSYKEEHDEIITKLGLKDRSAVGVLWLSKKENGFKMDPVVWVKSIDTFFYETSCGSGSIATAVATGATSVIQPSGKTIQVKVDDNGIELISEMGKIISYDDFTFVTLDKDSTGASSFFKGFSDLYIKSFSEAPYFESYDEGWLLENVWNVHLDAGVIVLALDGENVVGLSCALPLVKSDSQFEFINNLEQKPFNPEKAIYMSELAVDSKYRNLGIGSKLVEERLNWAKEKNYIDFVMRTAASGSNSLNLYKRMGVNEIAEKQNVKNSSIEVQSASEERIYLYGNL